MKKLKLGEFEQLQFAIETDYKPNKRLPVLTVSDMSDTPKYKNDMRFEMRLPNGTVESKFITRKILKELKVIKFVVKKIDQPFHYL